MYVGGWNDVSKTVAAQANRFNAHWRVFAVSNFRWYAVYTVHEECRWIEMSAVSLVLYAINAMLIKSINETCEITVSHDK